MFQQTRYRCLNCGNPVATAVGDKCAQCVRAPTTQHMSLPQQVDAALNTAFQAVPFGAMAYASAAKDLNCPSPYSEALTAFGACACGVCYVCHTRIFPRGRNIESLPKPFPHTVRVAGAATCSFVTAQAATSVCCPLTSVPSALANIVCYCTACTAAVAYQQYYARPYPARLPKPKTD